MGKSSGGAGRESRSREDAEAGNRALESLAMAQADRKQQQSQTAPKDALAADFESSVSTYRETITETPEAETPKERPAGREKDEVPMTSKYDEEIEADMTRRYYERQEKKVKVGERLTINAGRLEKEGITVEVVREPASVGPDGRIAKAGEYYDNVVVLRDATTGEERRFRPDTAESKRQWSQESVDKEVGYFEEKVKQSRTRQAARQKVEDEHALEEKARKDRKRAYYSRVFEERAQAAGAIKRGSSVYDDTGLEYKVESKTGGKVTLRAQGVDRTIEIDEQSKVLPLNKKQAENFRDELRRIK